MISEGGTSGRGNAGWITTPLYVRDAVTSTLLEHPDWQKAMSPEQWGRATALADNERIGPASLAALTQALKSAERGSSLYESLGGDVTVQWLLDLKADPRATERAASAGLEAYERAFAEDDEEAMVKAVESTQPEVNWPSSWEEVEDLTTLL